MIKELALMVGALASFASPREVRPSQYLDGLTYPSTLTLLTWDGMTSYPDRWYESVTATPDDNTIVFTPASGSVSGSTAFILSSIDLTYTEEDFAITSLTFAKFSDFGLSIFRQSPAFLYGFASITPNNQVVYAYERGFIGPLQYAFNTSNLRQSSLNYALDGSILEATYFYEGTSAGPYYVSMDVNRLISSLEDMFANMIGSIGITLNDYIKQAREEGYAQGQDYGYRLGYQEGIEDTEDGAILSNLFGSVVSVPISIMNGLTPLAIWDVPIISIVITLLLVGVILWIVRKVI